MYYSNSIQDSTMGNQQETSKIWVPQRLHVKLLSKKNSRRYSPINSESYCYSLFCVDVNYR